MRGALSSIFICLSVFLTGCAGDAPVKDITLDYRIVEEGAFTMRYPTNWKIISEIGESITGMERTSFRFYHPRNRNCWLSVEVILLSEDETESRDQVDQILAHKTREVREDFERRGFYNFRAQTFQARLSGRNAKKLKLSAEYENFTREIGVYTLKHRNHYYLISYQWQDNWDEAAKNTLLRRLHSFSVRG